jgi:hypothetical protein
LTWIALVFYFYIVDFYIVEQQTGRGEYHGVRDVSHRRQAEAEEEPPPEFGVSLAAHAALLAAGVASSFASVEELSAPNGPTITFLNLPTPPTPSRPAPPSPTSPGTTPQAAVRPLNRHRGAARHQAGDEGHRGAGRHRSNGDDRGDPNTIGAGGPRTETIPTLPPNVGKGFLAIDPQLPQYRPRMPRGTRDGRCRRCCACAPTARQRRRGQGAEGYDPSVDAAFVSALRTWRYSPFKVEGRPVPFCTNVAYSVQTTN